MRIVKMLSGMASIILLTILSLWALGVISRSPIATLGLGVVLIVVGALVWGHHMDAIASQSWLIRMEDSGATEAHDRILQDTNDLRRRTFEPRQRRHHD
jgi:hypothetical protein